MNKCHIYKFDSDYMMPIAIKADGIKDLIITKKPTRKLTINENYVESSFGFFMYIENFDISNFGNIYFDFTNVKNAPTWEIKVIEFLKENLFKEGNRDRTFYIINPKYFEGSKENITKSDLIRWVANIRIHKRF